ncbi:hypothetical protein RU09_09390 [Microbacterium sp. MEJ108Y]|nr:hypothetical protein RU09_09390 [Microbacterium sp. MEJ108Y]
MWAAAQIDDASPQHPRPGSAIRRAARCGPGAVHKSVSPAAVVEELFRPSSRQRGRPCADGWSKEHRCGGAWSKTHPTRPSGVRF